MECEDQSKGITDNSKELTSEIEAQKLDEINLLSKWIQEKPDMPLCSVTFYNNPKSVQFYQAFHKRIGKIIKAAFEESIDETKEGVSVSTCVENTDSSAPENYLSILNSSHYFCDYVLDAKGLNIERTNDSKIESEKLEYSVDAKYKLSDVVGCGTEKKTVDRGCFNCGVTTHSLSACPRPKDIMKIQERRREFMKSFNPVHIIPNIRYHENKPEAAQKFTPGVISDKLRAALRMGPTDLPPYIYQMRVKGYPPGYSLQAHLNSHVTIYDLEDQEIADKLEHIDLKTHMTYTIQYPGFNAPLPKGVIDRSREFGFPKIDASLFKLVKKPEKKKPETATRTAIPEVIDTSTINRGFYIDPLILNAFPPSRCWRNPPCLESKTDFDSIEKIILEPSKVAENPFSDEVIPTSRYLKILKLLKTV